MVGLSSLLLMKVIENYMECFNWLFILVFGDILKTKQPEVIKYTPKGLFNLFLYLLAAATFFLSSIYIFRYYRRYTSEKLGEKPTNKGVRIPNYSPTDYGGRDSFDDVDQEDDYL